MGEGEADLGTTGCSQRMKTSPTPARNGSIQGGPREPEPPWGVSVGGGVGQRAKKGRSEVERKFPHLPLKSPTEAQAWGPGRHEGQPHSSGYSKASCPSLTCPGLSPATVLKGSTGALKGQRQRCLPLREQTCIIRVPTVDWAAYTQASPASMLFGKTCPSCLLGQIPGQAAQPAGR